MSSSQNTKLKCLLTRTDNHLARTILFFLKGSQSHITRLPKANFWRNNFGGFCFRREFSADYFSAEICSEEFFLGFAFFSRTVVRRPFRWILPSGLPNPGFTQPLPSVYGSSSAAFYYTKCEHRVRFSFGFLGECRWPSFSCVLLGARDPDLP